MIDKREIILKRAAGMFKDGDFVNLGIGIPTKIPGYLPKGVNVICQSENGYIGIEPLTEEWQKDKDLLDTASGMAKITQGGSCFDSALSFTIIRGGHLAATVLGAMQVDEQGNLANWLVPGKMAAGMGGAMDLVVGARKVIIAMEHTTKDGKQKILKNCTLPLTAVNCVDVIVTDLCVMEYSEDGLILKELAPGVSIEDINANTEASFRIDKNIGYMPIE